MKRTTITLLIGLSCFGAMAQTNQFVLLTNGVNLSSYLMTNGEILLGEYSAGEALIEITGFETNGGSGKWTWTYPTNVMLGTNYTGTIQVGTNFYKVEDLNDDNIPTLIHWIHSPLDANLINHPPEYPTVKTNWIGHPMVSDNDLYTPSQGWIVEYEIGLRSDGVVVWRKTK